MCHAFALRPRPLSGRLWRPGRAGPGRAGRGGSPAGVGAAAGRQGLLPGPEGTEVGRRFPLRAAGEAEPPAGAEGKGVCVKVETLNKCW